jgi:serine/threonine-protein kinase
VSDAIDRLNSALEDRYEIERELGEGGMAKVYLARDLKHNRPVALKVLKPELSAVVGADRFLAEIETTANLRHPHILPLFDSGEADGFLFFVMPYVEGETLADRLKRESQLPVEEGVRIATAVANALDHAHRSGVIHRDIKPGNILMQDGEPVVSDFGIAIAVGAAGGSRLTETGLSVGTPFYMSPEQATGDQIVGPASDTYALGCVLYEMLVGEPPYLGNSAQAVLGKIIQGEPVSATSFRKSIPLNVDSAIRKALEKLPADRFASVGEFAKALADPAFRHGEPADPTAMADPGPWKRRTMVGWGLAAAFALAFGWSATRPEPPRQVGRFAIPADDGTAFTRPAVIMPDGTGMVYVAPGPEGQSMLWSRKWSETAGTPVRGTEGPVLGTSLSPDGLEVSFSAGGPGPLRVAPMLGGSVRTIAEESWGGGVWTSDGSEIFFLDATWGISRVPAGGGSVTRVISAPPDSLYGPLALLEDEGLLLVRALRLAQASDSEIRALRLETGEMKTLVEGTQPVAVTPGGTLVFGTADGAIMAAPLDLGELRVTSAPALMLEGLTTTVTFDVRASFSRDGSLVYLPGTSSAQATPVWVGRNGGMQPVDPGWDVVGNSTYSSVALSPEGGRLAISMFRDGVWDVWIKELDSGPLSRFTFEGTFNRRPTWAPDGETVYFLSGRGGNSDLWSRPADGSRAAELVYDHAVGTNEAFPTADGSQVVFRVGSNTGGVSDSDILSIRPGVDSEPTTLVDSDFVDWQPAISPDGRWLAYASNESGRYEVYVRPFPDAQTSRQQVSVDGGTEPVWSRDGSELFYRGPTHFVAAAVSTAPSFAVRGRTELFPVGQLLAGAGHPQYDVHPDGERFLMLLQGSVVPTALVLVQNWFDEVEARVGGRR